MAELRVAPIPFPAADSEPGVDTSLFAQCREVRRLVFIEEQFVPAELEWDGLDGDAEHFAVLHENDEDVTVLATARMRVLDDAAKAERVAVLSSQRHLGLGRLLMQAIEFRAREYALPRVRLNAQLSAAPFYDKLGYQREGETFLEAGIEHVAMSKRLDEPE
jgi:predicted GNAT family N-acyltransferase